MDFINFLLLLVGIVNLFFTLLLFIKGRKVQGGHAFAMVVLFTCFWIVSMILFRSVPDLSSSLLFGKLLYISAAILSHAFLLFTFIFTEKKLGPPIIIISSIIDFSLCVFIFFTDFFIHSIFFPVHGEKIFIWGRFYFLYVLYVFIYLSFGIFNLFQGMRIVKGIRGTQIRNVFWGYFLSANLAMVTNLFMPSFGMFQLNWLGQILTVFYVSFITYIILRYRFLDLTLILRRGFVFLSSLLLSFAVFFVGVFVLQKQFPLDNFSWIISAIIFWELSRRVLDRFIDKIWPVENVDLIKIFSKVPDDMSQKKEIEKKIPEMVRDIALQFQTDRCGIALKTTTSDTEYFSFWPKGFYLTWAQYNEILKFFHGDMNIIFPEELLLQGKEEIGKKLQAWHISAVVKIGDKRTYEGILILGVRKDAASWNREAISSLLRLRVQISGAIGSILLYDQAMESLSLRFKKS